MPDRSSESKPGNKANYRTVAAIAAAKKIDPASLAELGIADLPGGGIEIPFFGEDGEELFRRQRGRPGGPRFKQPAGVPLRLYGLWRLDRCRRAGHAWLCEGESDTWSLWAAELPALGVPGKDAARCIQLADVEDLTDLFVLPDNQPTGDAEKLLAAVAKQLAALAWPGRLWCVSVPDNIKDVSDWWASDPARFKEELTTAFNNRQRVELPAAPCKARADDVGKKYKPERQSVSTQLIELVSGAGVELFHNAEQSGFVRFSIDGHKEVWPVRSSGFRRWLSHLYFDSTGRAAGSQAVQDALGVLEGKACFEGVERMVSLRLAEHDGKIYLDLADKDWRVVEIDAADWRIADGPPVRFRRPKGLLPLPLPERGGRFDDLRQFVNVADDADWRLLIAWTIAALRPRGPYPILCLYGQQGSSKSTVARMLRALIDPSLAPLRSAPKEARDLMIAAGNSWMLCYDNLSSLPGWLSDGLCCLYTGGGFSTR
ncbi:MAG: hypothetical protein ACRELG_19600, partial [Gemmataceae bacterium]